MALSPPITGLHCWACLQLYPPDVHLHPADLIPVTWRHFCACTHSENLQPQECVTLARLTQLPMYPQLALAHATGSGSHSCVCVCNQLLPVHRQLQLASTAEYVHTTSASYHHHLTWSLVAAPGDTTKDSNSLCCCRETPATFTKNHTIVSAATPVA